MTKSELNKKYFEWMYQLVCDTQYTGKPSYQKLLSYLHSVDFVYIIAMDSNRAEDGRGLRYRFGYERRYSNALISSYLDDRPCSVLEMLIALSIRCEEHIMDDPDVGDRTGQWFWSMITNLGLISMRDSKFDRKYVSTNVARFLNREYESNGEGGLFVVEGHKYDLRSAEIWYQMCWYLNSII